jgi:hypothetical protein
MKSNDDHRQRTRVGAVALALALGPFGCGDDAGVDDHDAAPDVDGPIGGCEVTPGAWSADGFAENAAGALALRAAISNLAGTVMNTAEQTTWGDTPMNPPTLQVVTDAYEAGDPSVADRTPAALDALMDQMFADWVAAMAEDPAAYLFIDEAGLSWVASGVGGVHERPPADGTRRFRAYSASGVEQRQIVDKGLFVGTLYDYALGLTAGTITAATVQDIAAAWGANPALDASPAEGEPANDDSAAYAASMGLYDETATALIAAQAYAADDACTAERDAALVEVFRFWEEAMFARGTFYSGAPWRATLDPTVTDSILDPLHAASEGWGLILGLRGLPDPTSGPLAGEARVSTDADIDEALEALGIDVADISAGTTGEWLVESPTTYTTGFNGTFKGVMQDLFGWSEAQFTEYATTPVPSE